MVWEDRFSMRDGRSSSWASIEDMHLHALGQDMSDATAVHHHHHHHHQQQQQQQQQQRRLHLRCSSTSMDKRSIRVETPHRNRRPKTAMAYLRHRDTVASSVPDASTIKRCISSAPQNASLLSTGSAPSCYQDIAGSWMRRETETVTGYTGSQLPTLKRRAANLRDRLTVHVHSDGDGDSDIDMPINVKEYAKRLHESVGYSQWRKGLEWGCLRIYIAGCESEFRLERDLFTMAIMPKLREACLLRHIHINDIDFTWGFTKMPNAMELERRRVAIESSDIFIFLSGLKRGIVPTELPPSLSSPEYESLSLEELDVQLGILNSLNSRIANMYTRQIISTDVADDNEDIITEEAQRAKDIRDRVRSILGDNVVDYDSPPDESVENIDIAEIETFCERVFLDLWRIISFVYPQNDQISSTNISNSTTLLPPPFLTSSMNPHTIVQHIATKNFRGRSREIDQLREYLRTDDVAAVSVVGVSGSGRTTLLGHFSALIDRERRQNGVGYGSCFFHSVKNCEGSTNIFNLFCRLHEHLCSFHGFDATKNRFSVQSTLSDTLKGLLKLNSTTNDPLLIVIDDADELRIRHEPIPSLNWLISEVQARKCVKLILSTSTSVPDGSSLIKMRPLAISDSINMMMDCSLTRSQVDSLMNHVGRTRLPLSFQLFVACWNLISSKSFSENWLNSIPKKIEPLVQYMILEPLERIYGLCLVADLLSLIVCSDGGLRIRDLRLLMGSGILPLPAAKMDQLIEGVLPIVDILCSDRDDSSNDEIITIFHESVRQYVVARYLHTPTKIYTIHRRLALYYHSIVDPRRDLTWECYNAFPQGLHLLTYHLGSGQMWKELLAVLSSSTFVLIKAKIFGVESIKLDAVRAFEAPKHWRIAILGTTTRLMAQIEHTSNTVVIKTDVDWSSNYDKLSFYENRPLLPPHHLARVMTASSKTAHRIPNKSAPPSVTWYRRTQQGSAVHRKYTLQETINYVSGDPEHFDAADWLSDRLAFMIRPSLQQQTVERRAAEERKAEEEAFRKERECHRQREEEVLAKHVIAIAELRNQRKSRQATLNKHRNEKRSTDKERNRLLRETLPDWLMRSTNSRHVYTVNPSSSSKTQQRFRF